MSTYNFFCAHPGYSLAATITSIGGGVGGVYLWLNGRKNNGNNTVSDETLANNVTFSNSTDAYQYAAQVAHRWARENGTYITA